MNNEALERTNVGLQKTIEALRKKNNQLKQEAKIWRNTAMSTQKSLVEYLATLNSAESQWGVWVNPENVDEYRVGQFIFDNGGIDDGWICAGRLDNLSFGFQSQRDAIEQYLKESNGLIQYGDRRVKVNIPAIVEAWSNGYLDADFQEFLEERAESIEQIWAVEEAEGFVYNQLSLIIEQAQEDLIEV